MFKKKLILMLSCFVIINVNNDVISEIFKSDLLLTENNVQVEKKPDGSALFLGDEIQFLCPLGAPDLPFHVFRVSVPPRSDYETLNIVMKSLPQYEKVPGSWDIKPVPDLVPLNDHINRKNKTLTSTSADYNPLIYDSDRYYPDKTTGEISIGQLRQYVIVEIPVALFRYHPKQKILEKLISYQAELNISIKDKLPGTFSSFLYEDPYGDQSVKAVVSNYSQLSDYYPQTIQKRNKSISGYIIITTQSIVNHSKQLDSFIELKKQQGFLTEVITESQWGGGKGDSACEKIRNWLKINYLKKTIKYVLLIGNPDPETGDVPMKMLWPRNFSNLKIEDKKAPSDYYYSELTGDWDYDNDNKYGEFKHDFKELQKIKLTPDNIRWNDVIVGRIPYYGNIDDLDIILKKTIDYQLDVNGFWRQNFLVAIKPTSINPDDDNNLGELIINNISSTAWEYYRIYDNSPHYNPEKYPCTLENVTNSIVNSRFGVALWWTHGTKTKANNIADVEQVKKFDNSHPFIVFQCSCNNAYPEHTDNLAYSLLRNGAIVTVAATRKTWSNPDRKWILKQKKQYSISSMAIEYITHMIHNKQMSCGEILNKIKDKKLITFSKQWMNYLVMCLYGDPSINIYSWLKYKCAPPLSGDWIIRTSCALHESCTAPANVIVTNESVLTIPNGISLDIDLSNFNLTVNKGSGVFIEKGGTMK